MNDTSTVTKVHWLANILRPKVADILFHRRHACVLSQFPIELVNRHVHGENFRRSVLQQAVGKAAGRAAHVHANSIPRTQPRNLPARLRASALLGSHNAESRRRFRCERRWPPVFRLCQPLRHSREFAPRAPALARAPAKAPGLALTSSKSSRSFPGFVCLWREALLGGRSDIFIAKSRPARHQKFADLA